MEAVTPPCPSEIVFGETSLKGAFPVRWSCEDVTLIWRESSLYQKRHRHVLPHPCLEETKDQMAVPCWISAAKVTLIGTCQLSASLHNQQYNVPVDWLSNPGGIIHACWHKRMSARVRTCDVNLYLHQAVICMLSAPQRHVLKPRSLTAVLLRGMEPSTGGMMCVTGALTLHVTGRSPSLFCSCCLLPSNKGKWFVSTIHFRHDVLSDPQTVAPTGSWTPVWLQRQVKTILFLYRVGCLKYFITIQEDSLILTCKDIRRYTPNPHLHQHLHLSLNHNAKCTSYEEIQAKIFFLPLSA